MILSGDIIRQNTNPSDVIASWGMTKTIRSFDMDSISGIYEIRNTTNGHRYIGSAVNINRRWIEHRSLLSKNKHGNPYLQNAYNKYGKDCFVFLVLDNCEKEHLVLKEQFYIDTLRPEYNIAKKAYSSFGTKRTQEQRERMSMAQKGHKRLLGHKNALGCKHTQEQNIAKSLLMQGEKRALGYKHTIEAKLKISFASKNRSAETQEKIYFALSNRSVETREKMSASAKAAWLKRKERTNDSKKRP